MNTIFKFFEPGFTSFSKNKASFVGFAIVCRDEEYPLDATFLSLKLIRRLCGLADTF